ncbi:MAG: metallophosphoesterase family protein [Bacilli bacterium]|nr:metallophosphoesterase family protein [Bacilli bacterium]
MKIAMVADLHFGIKKGDPTFLQSQMKFFKEQLVPELTAADIKELWILGDVFDTRQALNTMIVNNVIDLFQTTLRQFDIKIIVGNHDMYLTTDTKINSLKILDLLPNVTVYEKQEELNIDNKKILMLPWITDYAQENLIVGKYDYCFCHCDIIGFDLGGGRLSETGLYAKNLLDKIDCVYTGHYHNGVHRQFEKGKSITYLGSPYQLTRIDRDGKRGYHILDIETGDRTFIENNMSMKFTRHIYPNANLNIISGNVVDLDIPYEFADQTKKISDYVNKLEKLNPAYPVNINILPSDEDIIETIDTSNLNIISLFKNYLDQLETNLNKDKLYDNFIELYNNYKEQL